MTQHRQSLALLTFESSAEDRDRTAPLHRASMTPAANCSVAESVAAHPLDLEIARAEEAYQLMLAADACLKSGADRLLFLLGFSAVHVSELRAQSGPRGGYPAYSLRNIRRTLRHLRAERETDLSRE